MTTSVRYKFVKNATGAALTATTFPMQGDGDDRQFRVVKHVLVAADIGTGAGQTGHASGMILDVLSSTTNPLWVLGFVSRPTAAVSGMVPYHNIDNASFTPAVPVTQIQAQFGIDANNVVRMIDANVAAGTAALAVGDVVTALIFIGAPQESADIMNPVP